MPTPDEIRSLVDTYEERFSAGDAASWSELFAADGTHEDPVGTPTNHGREAIREFYANSMAIFGSLRVRKTGPTIVTGNEAAVAFEAFAGSGEDRVQMPHIIDVFKFNDEGEIQSLRAYWQMDSVVPAPE